VSTSKVILVVMATVVIFASGLITGGLLVRQAAPPNPLPPAPLFAGRFDALRRGTEGLENLSPAQRAHINRILRDSQERISDFFLLFEPDIQDVFRKMREEIRAELNPAQRRQLEDFMRQRARRFEERQGGGGFRPWNRGPGLGGGLVSRMSNDPAAREKREASQDGVTPAAPAPGPASTSPTVAAPQR
jgi:hypothetical protein